jgi:hypothetical protein
VRESVLQGTFSPLRAVSQAAAAGVAKAQKPRQMRKALRKKLRSEGVGRKERRAAARAL